MGHEKCFVVSRQTGHEIIVEERTMVDGGASSAELPRILFWNCVRWCKVGHMFIKRGCNIQVELESYVQNTFVRPNHCHVIARTIEVAFWS